MKSDLACLPVYSPRINLDMITVKMGAELFTVSANDTATFFRLTNPRTTVVNLARADAMKWNDVPLAFFPPFLKTATVSLRCARQLAVLCLRTHPCGIYGFSCSLKKKHLMSPTNSMIMMKLGGYSDLDLCW